MDADHVLRTTRSVRLRLDFERPIDPAVIEECLDVALQAPTASNSQQWQWVVITDPDKISAVADIYRKSFQVLTDRPPEQRPSYGPDDSRTHQSEKVTRSAMYLAAEMHRCPAMLIACINGRIEQLPATAHAGVYGSILPGAWSFMLAARERGIGMAWTTIHLRNEADVAASCSASPTTSPRPCSSRWPTSPAKTSSRPRESPSPRSSTGTPGASARRSRALKKSTRPLLISCRGSNPRAAGGDVTE